MKYVFDTNVFSAILKNYYKSRFPSFWKIFDEYVNSEKIISVKEVYNELKVQFKPTTKNKEIYESEWDWIKNNKGIFKEATNEETNFVRQIVNNEKFKGQITRKQTLIGKPIADPLIIAEAKNISGCVVTTEKFKPNSIKIPNICNHYNIDCINFEQFMEREDWKF